MPRYPRYPRDAVSVAVLRALQTPPPRSKTTGTLEWRMESRRLGRADVALRKARGNGVLAPVVVRWRAGAGEFVWVHPSIEDAASFAGWLTRQDHG